MKVDNNPSGTKKFITTLFVGNFAPDRNDYKLGRKLVAGRVPHDSQYSFRARLFILAKPYALIFLALFEGHQKLLGARNPVSQLKVIVTQALSVSSTVWALSQ